MKLIALIATVGILIFGYVNPTLPKENDQDAEFHRAKVKIIEQNVRWEKNDLGWGSNCRVTLEFPNGKTAEVEGGIAHNLAIDFHLNDEVEIEYAWTGIFNNDLFVGSFHTPPTFLNNPKMFPPQ